MRLLTILLICSLFTTMTYAQSRVRGQVIDYKTQQGIGDCNIYLSGTSKGTFSNAKGFFEITGVPDGIYEVVFSHVSYRPHVQVIEVKGKDVSIKSSLAINPTSLTTVEVVNEKDKARRRRALKKFKDFFFGKQYQEASIYIKNEDIIDLSKEKNGVITSKNPYSLQVTNDYLGYDMEYYVEEFLLSNTQNMVLGFPKFSQQQTDNPTKKLVWLENRQRSYNGSLRHFFASLIDGSLTEQGFEAFLSSDDPEVLEEEEPGAEFYAERSSQRYLVDAKKLPVTITIDNTEFANIKKINFSQIFDVNYTKEFGRISGYQNSKMKLVQDYVYVYTNGVVVNPSALKLFGRWADEGAYELLPYDYVSNDTLELNDNLNRQERLAELNQLVQEQPKEKIYLHTNRSDYYPDETLWFKAYVVAGPIHQPSPLSHNIYVDLISPDQKVIKQLLLASKEGFVHGSIELDKKLKRGKYILQAYTEGMKGESPGYFFRKEIEVNDILGREKRKLIAKDIDLQIFPESGNLVSDVTSVVAFKATDEYGMPVALTGKVYSTSGNDQKMVAQLFTRHDGMGSFTFTPQEGLSYYVLTDQTDKKYELPQVNATGVSMMIDNVSSEEFVNVKVLKNAQTKADGSFLIGHSRGWLNYTASAEFRDEQEVDIKIYRKDLREGINHLTLFDKRGKPLAERLFYIRKNNGLTVSLTTEKETYQKREITKVNIKVSDENGAPVEGNFSLTAFNQDRVNTVSPNDNIVSSLLLNSDMKGYIHHPAYYFEKVSPVKNSHLDLVMMTNGWTRFQWEDLKELTKETPEIDYVQRLDIQGRMLIDGRSKPVKFGTVTYINNNSETPETLVATTDKNGRFVIEDASPLENKAFLLKGNTAKNKDFVKFDLDTIIRQVPVTGPYREVTIEDIPEISEEESTFSLDDNPQSSKANFIAKDNKDFLSTLQILETVVVEAEKEAPKRVSLYGPPSTSLELEPIVRDYGGTNIFRFLKGRLSGVRIRDNDLATTIEIRNIVTSTAIVGDGSDDPLSGLITSNPQNPLILLDNVPVGIEVIIGLPSSIIERVEVFKGPDAIAFGSNGGNGVMLFFTKPGYDPSAYIETKGIQSFMVNGYHVAKEFYVPKYDASYSETGVPDYRIALHWEPTIKTDKNGEASVSFYNSDDTDRIKVILEGISFTGTPGFGSMTYSIEENQN